MRVEGEPALGAQIGADLATLHGSFRPPYAPVGTRDGDLVIEGYGCNPRAPVRRHAANSRPFPWAGFDLEFDGVVCHGDSGGALWQGGELVGILTAVCEKCATPTGYATEVPALFRPPPPPRAGATVDVRTP